MMSWSSAVIVIFWCDNITVQLRIKNTPFVSANVFPLEAADLAEERGLLLIADLPPPSQSFS